MSLETILSEMKIPVLKENLQTVNEVLLSIVYTHRGGRALTGWTCNTVTVYRVLGADKPATVKEIMSKTGLPRSTVYATLQRLLDAGLVERKSYRNRDTEGPRESLWGLIA